MSKFDEKKIKLRRAFSLEAIEENPGEESGDEAMSEQGAGTIIDPETGKPRHMRRYSFPLSPTTLAGVPRADFASALEDLRGSKTDNLLDNVYAQAKAPSKDKEIKRKKMVSRRT
jgi:hypothetical protein